MSTRDEKISFLRHLDEVLLYGSLGLPVPIRNELTGATRFWVSAELKKLEAAKARNIRNCAVHNKKVSKKTRKYTRRSEIADTQTLPRPKPETWSLAAFRDCNLNRATERLKSETLDRGN